MTNNPNMTLRQALDNFRIKNEKYLSHNKAGVPPKVKQFFYSHDVAHVLFNCDITLFGEGSVKIWTIFGTSLGFFNHIREYKKANAFGIAQKISIRHYLRDIFKLLFSAPILIYKAKK